MASPEVCFKETFNHIKNSYFFLAPKDFKEKFNPQKNILNIPSGS